MSNFKRSTLIMAVLTATLAAGGCVHTSEAEKAQKSYAKVADDRIDTMRGNIKSLEHRRDELLGVPRAQLDAAIANLRTATNSAQASLDELDARNADTWVAKKPEVDRQMSEMDQAYNRALAVLQAH